MRGSSDKARGLDGGHEHQETSLGVSPRAEEPLKGSYYRQQRGSPERSWNLE